LRTQEELTELIKKINSEPLFFGEGYDERQIILDGVLQNKVIHRPRLESIRYKLWQSYVYNVENNEVEKMSHRQALLEEATKVITKDRNNSYGEPDQDFKRTAKLWNIYLADKEYKDAATQQDLEGYDVAIMMMLLKISRLSWNPTHKDSWLDLAGYAACGYETMKIGEENDE